MPNPFLREVEHFFSTYKQLEGIAVETHGWVDCQAALDEVDHSVTRYKKSQM